MESKNRLVPITLLLCEITDSNIRWAKKQYPQFYCSNFSKKKQDSFLLSRALLLLALNKYFGLTEIPEIAYTEHRKPYFLHHNLSFNISHSDDFVALVIGKGNFPIGVDIEQIKQRKNFAGLINKVFTLPEKKWIFEQRFLYKYPSDTMILNQDEMTRFFLLWSAKEAYLKADGRGIQGLESLSLNPNQGTIDGDLSDGILLLTTISTDEQAIENSLALYLPNQLKETFTVKTVAIKDEIMAIEPLPISWIISLND